MNAAVPYKISRFCECHSNFFQDLQPTLPTLPTSQIQLYPQIAFSSHVTVMNLLALAYQQVTIKWYISLGQPGGGGSNPL